MKLSTVIKLEKTMAAKSRRTFLKIFGILPYILKATTISHNKSTAPIENQVIKKPVPEPVLYIIKPYEKQTTARPVYIKSKRVFLAPEFPKNFFLHLKHLHITGQLYTKNKILST